MGSIASLSIWAKASWGVWWNWGDRQLLVFLTLYLFYGAFVTFGFITWLRVQRAGQDTDEGTGLDAAARPGEPLADAPLADESGSDPAHVDDRAHAVS